MPGDEFKQVLQGHRQAISARAWNAVLRTQAEAKDHAHDIAANLSQGPRSQTLVLVQNNSGANRAPSMSWGSALRSSCPRST